MRSFATRENATRCQPTKQTEIGDIPERWQVVRLGEIAQQLRSGVTPKGGEKVYLKAGIPLIRSQNVLMNKLSVRDVAFIPPEVHESMIGSSVQPGDVLLNITGASIGRVAHVPGDLKIANVNQHVCRIRLSQQADPAFICYFLSTAKGQAQIMGSQFGTTRQGLNYGNVRAIRVPLPDIEEQRAIAVVLETVQKARESRQRELALKRERKTALADYLFNHGTRSEQTKQTDFGEIPQSWRVLPLGKVVKFKSGSTRPRDLSDTPTEQKCVPVYGGNGVMGYTAYGSSNEKLLTIGRVGAYCGCVHIAEAPNWITDNALYSAQFLEDVSIEFLAEHLEYLQLNQLKRTGAQPLITQGVLHALDISLPLLADQKAIAHMLRACDQQLLASQREADVHEELFVTMLEELTCGRTALAALPDSENL